MPFNSNIYSGVRAKVKQDMGISIKEDHVDDLAVVGIAGKMKEKLAKQRDKGYGGWNEESCTQEHLSKLLREHVDKGDPVDVANFCAFLVARGEGIL